MSMTNKYILEFTKVRDVKTPEKAWNAAGWDFYVPENLHITDFTKNYGMYVNDNLVNKHEQYSPTFLLKNKDDGKELWIRFFKNPEDKNIRYWNCNSNMEIAAQWNSWIENEHTYVQSIDLDMNEKVLIPSGIHVKLPENVFLKAENKSGIAAKRGLIFGSSVVDTDYEGEIHISLINACNNIAVINAGDKVIQFVPFFQPVMREVKEYDTIEKLYANSKSERGDGGFGSSDKK